MTITVNTPPGAAGLIPRPAARFTPGSFPWTVAVPRRHLPAVLPVPVQRYVISALPGFVGDVA